MEVDLSKIAMNKGQQYEAIITTVDNNGNTNAAPFGVRILEKDKVLLRIFEGGNSIKNIKENRTFIVNISANPLMLTLATIDTIPKEYLTIIENEEKGSKLAYLSNSDAYFICEVESMKTGMRNDEFGSSEVNMIKANVVEMKINSPCVKPINRGIHALLESLVNYSRINIVDDETQKYFLDRFKEAERLIKKVGDNEEKEAIEILKETLIKQGYEI